jgi:V/A-type H+/Na+-transporting ATPase subunit E
MGLDEVREEILSAGRAAAQAVLAEAEAEAARMTAEANKRARAVVAEKLQQAERRARQLRVQELASSELEGKRARLAMERELLEAAAEQARASIAALPKDQDERLLERILAKHSVFGYRVYSARKNEAFLRAMPSVEYAGNVNCLGGILFESRDGTVRMDFTYDTMLRDLVERNMKEIARLLFSG